MPKRGILLALALGVVGLLMIADNLAAKPLEWSFSENGEGKNIRLTVPYDKEIKHFEFEIIGISGPTVIKETPKKRERLPGGAGYRIRAYYVPSSSKASSFKIKVVMKPKGRGKKETFTTDVITVDPIVGESQETESGARVRPVGRAAVELARKAKEKADREAKEKTDREAREEANRIAKLEADRIAKLEADRIAKLEADRIAKEEADRKARLEADRKARLEADREARLEADREARLEADREARLEADRRARLEADRRAEEDRREATRLEADRIAKEEADRIAKGEADRKAEEDRREAQRKVNGTGGISFSELLLYALLMPALFSAAVLAAYIFAWPRWSRKKEPEFSKSGKFEELTEGSWRRTIKCKSWKQVRIHLIWEFQQLEYRSEIPPRIQCFSNGKSLGTLSPGVRSESKELERLGPAKYVPLPDAKNIPLDFKLIEPSDEEIEQEIEIQVDYWLNWIDADGRHSDSWTENVYMKFRPPSRRKTKEPEPRAETSDGATSTEGTDAENFATAEGLARAIWRIEQLEKRPEGTGVPSGEPRGSSERFTSGSLPSVACLLPELALLTLVNWWWKNPNVSRKDFAQQLPKGQFNIGFYDMKGAGKSLSNIAESAYAFEPSPREGGWLWVSDSAGDFYTLPAVQSFFRVADAMPILRRMFKGIGKVTPSDFKFDHADKACRLRRVSNQQSKYTIVNQGKIALKTSDGRQLLSGPSTTGTAAKQFVRSEATTRQISDLDASVEQLKKDVTGLLASVKRPAADTAVDSKSAIDSSIRALKADLRNYLGSELQTVRGSIRGVQEVISNLQAEQATIVESQSSLAEDLGKRIDDLRNESRAPQAYNHLADRVGSFGLSLDGFGNRLSDLTSTVQDIGSRLFDLESTKWETAQRVPPRQLSPAVGPTAIAVNDRPDATPIEDMDLPSSEPESDIKPTKVLAPPSGWEEVIGEVVAKGPPQGKGRQQTHLLRLIQLRDLFQKRMSGEEGAWSVDIVHVQPAPEVDGVKIDPVAVDDKGDKFGVRTGRSTLVGSYYVQLFLHLSKNGYQDSVLFLAPGEFDERDYSGGYQLLIDNLPGKIVRINGIKRPARLSRQAKERNSFYVEQKMRIKYD